MRLGRGKSLSPQKTPLRPPEGILAVRRSSNAGAQDATAPSISAVFNFAGSRALAFQSAHSSILLLNSTFPVTVFSLPVKGKVVEHMRHDPSYLSFSLSLCK